MAEAGQVNRADFPRLLHLPNRPECRQPIIVVDVIVDRGVTGRIRVSPARVSPTCCGCSPHKIGNSRRHEVCQTPASLIDPFDRLDNTTQPPSGLEECDSNRWQSWLSPAQNTKQG